MVNYFRIVIYFVKSSSCIKIFQKKLRRIKGAMDLNVEKLSALFKKAALAELSR